MSRSSYYVSRESDRSLVTLRIIYHLPDFSNLINFFIWETFDEVPALPRVHRFLGYWQRNIDAVIKEVAVSNINLPETEWRRGLYLPLKHVHTAS
jgi:uncharacterized protein Usg